MYRTLIPPVTALAIAVVLLFLPSLSTLVIAGNFSSEYSKLDFDKGCVWQTPLSDEEAQMGGEAVCKGYKDYPIYFQEGDLRQFTAYGPADDPFIFRNGFSEWNAVHTVVEWRLDDGVPFATIHRWYLDNIDPQTGSADAARRGQVLVVSRVADPLAPAGKRVSCTVGYVDARANKNANVLARKVADEVGRWFLCGTDVPRFHGKRGPYSGTPNDLSE